MEFNKAFASNVFNGIEELLTVPWYQGLDTVQTAFSAQWNVIQEGSVRSVDANNTLSYLWTLFEPSYARMIKPNSSIPTLDFLYIGIKNGMMLGFGRSQGYDQPAEGWYQPDRNNTCNFTSSGVLYAFSPDETVPVGQRTKAQSGCLQVYDGSGVNSRTGQLIYPTSAFNYDPTVRSWYIKAAASLQPGWTDPYVYAGTGSLGITAAAPLFAGSELLGV